MAFQLNAEAEEVEEGTSDVQADAAAAAAELKVRVAEVRSVAEDFRTVGRHWEILRSGGTSL